MAAETQSIPATTGDQASRMAGCGCLVLIAIFVGPLVTDWLGLSPWLIGITFAFALAVMLLSKGNPYPLPRTFLLALLLIGAVGSLASGDKVAEDNAKAVTAPQPAPAPTVESTLAAKTLPVPTSRKEQVRITLDQIQSKFAKNQVAGAQFFETRTALIPGVAVRVREALGTGILVIRSPKTGFEMEIGFNERGTRQLAAVEPGDRIEATCPSIYEAMSQIIIACDEISIVPR